MPNQFLLFKIRRFWPLFWVQFLGAFNDNLMKTAVVVLVAYGLWDTGGVNPAVLVSLAAAVFILPFVLICPLAGDITDRVDKAAIIRIVKKAEIVIVLLAVAALYLKSTLFALLVLIALGAQSAFFAPAKYAILPQHLKPEELIAGNGLVSTGTYVAILAGTLLGALLATTDWGIALISIVLLAAALVGYWASLSVPEAPPVQAPGGDRLGLKSLPDKLVREIKGSWAVLQAQPSNTVVAVFGVSWFYFVAALFHAQFPNYAKMTLGVDTSVLAFFMLVFSIGIAVGGMLNNRILNARVSVKYVPWALAGMAFFAADLYWASLPYAGHGDGSLMVTSFARFIQSADGIRITADLLFLSMAGGLYVVPLRSYVQHHALPEQKARVIGGNSFMDAIFILASAVMAAVVLYVGFEVIDLFLILALACAGLAVYGLRRKPLGEG